jgi:hypothetical protein
MLAQKKVPVFTLVGPVVLPMAQNGLSRNAANGLLILAQIRDDGSLSRPSGAGSQYYGMTTVVSHMSQGRFNMR